MYQNNFKEVSLMKFDNCKKYQKYEKLVNNEENVILNENTKPGRKDDIQKGLKIDFDEKIRYNIEKCCYSIYSFSKIYLFSFYISIFYNDEKKTTILSY